MAVATFPAFHVTGPVHHYVRRPARYAGDPNANSIFYLGTAETQPRMAVTHVRRPIINDLAGPDVPAQKKDGGRLASISVLFNRFSHWALDDLRPPGRASRFSRGQTVYGVKTFELWQVYENTVLAVGPPVNADLGALYPDLPWGFYWPQVDWVTDEHTPGNIDEKVLVQWEASEVFTGLPTLVGRADGATVIASHREWVLFSQAAADFPAAVRVPQ